MKNIVKNFPGTRACDNISFGLKKGEIHILLGENGAGKSTLMNILSGLYLPDQGEIYVKGKQANIKSPRDAFDLGIGIVHQHFKLVSAFTVAENIVLGSKDKKINHKFIKEELSYMFHKYGAALDFNSVVEHLSVAAQQKVEILKVLYRQTDTLILDEPTAVLTPQEVDDLFVFLKDMKGRGNSIILITHKINEAMAIADRITVLRQGRLVDTMDADGITVDELNYLMVGQDMPAKHIKSPAVPGRKILKMENVDVIDEKGIPRLSNVSLEIYGGEILGVAGVSGNGQKELAEVIYGLCEPESGKIFIDGKDLTGCSPKTVINSGVSLIPEDRLSTGLVPNMNVMDNVMLTKINYGEYKNRWVLNYAAITEYCRKLVKDHQIKLSDLGDPIKGMSGGNLQKLLIARETSKRPSLIIAAYPFRGLDISAVDAVRNILLEQRKAGAAIMLISEDLDDLIQIADRIAVLYKGRNVGVVDAGKTNKREIGLLMAGGKESGGGSSARAVAPPG